MRRTNLRDFGKGLAALGGVLLLLLGPPLALVRFVGWPLPGGVPSVDEFTSATRGGVSDMAVVKALAVVAWLCWVQIAIAVVVEVSAMLRGRVAGRAPVLAGLQRGVGKLVATAALVAASWGAPRSLPPPLPVTRLAVIASEPHLAAVPVHNVALAQEAAPSVRQGTSVEQAQRVYVVRKNDSWWAIAERELGDGQRWHELRDANLGRRMSDGTVVVEDSILIRPGWEVLLPTTQVPASTAEVSGVDEVEVGHGDNMWVLAERHLRDAIGDGVKEDQVREHWTAAIEMNRDRFADPTNPSLIFTGQRMRMPASNGSGPTAVPPEPAPPLASAPTTVPPQQIPARPDAAPGATPATTAPVTSTPSTAPAARPPASVDAPSVRVERRSEVPLELLGAASTVLAVGIAAALNRRRRRRQLGLPPRSLPPEPPAELEDLRATLVVNADVDHVTRLHRALRDVAIALNHHKSEARVRLVQVAGTRIEVLLSAPGSQAAKPWRADPSGLTWELKGEPVDRDDDGIAPIPALVTLGRPDDSTELYLDLEAEGVVSLLGNEEEIAGVARSWILELATSPMATGVSVVVVGSGLAPSSDNDRVRRVDSWQEIEAEAIAWSEQSSALLKARRWATPASGRLRSDRPDDLAPLVVVVRDVPGERVQKLATAILDQQSSVVVVAVGSEVEGALRMDVTGDTVAIASLGLSCRAQVVTEDVSERVDQLLEDASQIPSQLTLLPSPRAAPPTAVETQGDDYRDPPYDILVRLLGDISVVGTPRSLKPKQLAVLAYIALNAPVAAERIEDALWVTPTASRRKRLANTVSEIRSVVGATNLPISVDGRYRVGPGVATDVELFERRVEHAARQDDLAAAGTLRGALELVDGPVFTYRNVDRMSYVWVDIDNWISTWELRVTDVAEDLAQRYLDLGDPASAVWACRRGLKACPTHGRMNQLLVHAHRAAGDDVAAQRVIQSHRSAMERLDLDVDDDIDEVGGSTPLVAALDGDRL